MNKHFAVLGHFVLVELEKGFLGILSRSGEVDLVDNPLGFGLLLLGQLVEDVGRFVNSATLLTRGGKDFLQGVPEA